jgi:hypothetical protein
VDLLADLSNDVLMTVASTSWWTANHILILINGVLAAASVGAVIASLKTIKATNRVVTATEEQAKKLGEQVEIDKELLVQEKRVLLTSTKPLLVEVPLGVVIEKVEFHGVRELDQGRIYWEVDRNERIGIRVPFRNVGSGPAFIHSVYFSPNVGAVVKGWASSGVVPVGELVNAYYEFTPGSTFFSVRNEWLAAGHIMAGILYSDLGSNQKFQSVLSVQHAKDSESFFADQVLLYNCDENWIRETDPFVQTGETTPI